MNAMLYYFHECAAKDVKKTNTRYLPVVLSFKRSGTLRDNAMLVNAANNETWLAQTVAKQQV